MEYVRFLHRDHFDPRPQQNRFKSLAFKNSSNGGGASVVQRPCVDATGLTICDHARKYYSPRVTGEPPIFWIFDEAVLSTARRFEKIKTDSGDECHYNLHGVSDAELKRLLKATPLSDFMICENRAHRPLLRDDLPAPPPTSAADITR
jgi:hypothetical protein